MPDNALFSMYDHAKLLYCIYYIRMSKHFIISEMIHFIKLTSLSYINITDPEKINKDPYAKFEFK